MGEKGQLFLIEEFQLINTKETREIFKNHHSAQFNSVTHSCLTLCNPMNRSTPGLPVHHQLPEFTEYSNNCFREDLPVKAKIYKQKVKEKQDIGIV